MKQIKLNPRFAVIAALVLSACGPQAFVPGTVTSNQDAAGTLNIPPKVDIVMGISQDGTMSNIASGPQGLSADIQGFVDTLKAKNWDYRFIAIPLHETDPGSSFNINNKASVSFYDGNYVSSGVWTPPYPGAVASSNAILPSLFSAIFSIPGFVNGYNNAHETGLRNQIQFLSRSDVLTNFIRPDALLSIITFSNGDDHSSGNTSATYRYCHSSGNSYSYDPAPSETVEPYGYWQQRNNGLNCINDYNYVSQPNKTSYVANHILPAKMGNTSLLKYYSLIAGSNSCRGMASRVGTDYIAAANALSSGNHVIDICPYTQSAAGALTQVANDLTQQQAVFRKVFLKVPSDPSLDTIKVTKISGGVSQVIPNDPTNGWTYYGNITNPVYSIDAFQISGDPTWHPYPAKPISGYIIQLNGTARMIGGETSRVEYMNSGAVISQ